jgi:SAM-dependent methyltransferase
MARSIFADMYAPYSALESYLYDLVIAPAVADLGQSLLGTFVDLLPDRGKVLDVGCGGGQLVCWLAEIRPTAEIVGLDLSQEQVERATRRASEQGISERVRFVQGSALELPFEADCFDAVTSVASIKHWPDQDKGLWECVRVLKPGGWLLVFEADRGCRFEDATRLVRGWRMPRALRPFGLALFRTWVAGQALDLDDARRLTAALPLTEARAERVEGTPGLLLGGRKRAA